MQARSAELVEAQEALSSTKQLIVAAKEAELAEALKRERTKDEQLAETQRRFDKVAEHLKVAREELKLRSEQQRLANERLRDAEETLRARDAELALKGEVSKAHQARAEGAAERLAMNTAGSDSLQAQLVDTHERLAQLSQEVQTARARERRAADEAKSAREQKEILEAQVGGAHDTRLTSATHQSPSPPLAFSHPRHPSPSLFLILAGSERPDSARRCWREGEGGA